MSEKQDELVKLQDDLVKTISVRDSSTREAEELKNLWEAEVRGTEGWGSKREGGSYRGQIV